MFVLCFILAVFGETITVIDPTNERAYTQDVGIFDGSSLGQVRHDPFSSISGSWAGTHSGVTVDAVDRYFRGLTSSCLDPYQKALFPASLAHGSALTLAWWLSWWLTTQNQIWAMRSR